MASPTRRTREPRRLKAFKGWAVVNFDGDLLDGEQAGDELLGACLAIYPRRYLARIVASKDPSLRVVPVAIRSLQHRPR
jgi:hypothetical protein